MVHLDDKSAFSSYEDYLEELYSQQNYYNYIVNGIGPSYPKAAAEARQKLDAINEDIVYLKQTKPELFI